MKIVFELFNKLVGQELSAEEMEQVSGGLMMEKECKSGDVCCWQPQNC